METTMPGLSPSSTAVFVPTKFKRTLLMASIVQQLESEKDVQRLRKQGHSRSGFCFLIVEEDAAEPLSDKSARFYLMRLLHQNFHPTVAYVHVCSLSRMSSQSESHLHARSRAVFCIYTEITKHYVICQSKPRLL